MGVLEKVARFFRRVFGGRGQGKTALSPGDLRSMVRGILSTHENEIDCEQCFEQLDRFVELVLDGANAEEALPLVQDHLNRCGDCREEFEALLAAVRQMGDT
jgi:hypothetical protein